MKMSLTEFKEELPLRICQFLWRQWAQLGLAAADVERRDHWIIDPEALLLISSTFARYDARLYDEIIDWLNVNHQSLNTARLRSVHRKFGFNGGQSLSAMLSQVSKYNKRFKWKLDYSRNTEKLEPLFLSVRHDDTDGYGPRDQDFISCGFSRGHVQLRGLSRRFNHAKPECMLLRLRALFGSTARADIIAYLITHESIHPSKLAKDTGFSQKNVQDTLVEMKDSGYVTTAKVDGRMKLYFIKRNHKQQFLSLGDNATSSLEWVNWLARFRALELLRHGLDNIDPDDQKEILIDSLLRDTMENMKPFIEQSESADSHTIESTYSGNAFREEFLRATNDWLTHILKEE